MRTSTAVDEIERRALFRLDANRGLAAKRSAFGRQTKLVIDAAACTVQSDDILTGIRSSVHRIGFRSAVGFGVDLRRGCTAVLFINVEIHLVHVGLCGRSIIADVVDSIAPEPFPSFLRNRVAALRTVSEALTLVDEFIIRNLFEEVRKALTVRVANLVIDNHSVAGIDTGAVIYAIPRDEVGFHVTQTIRSDNCQVFVVVNRTAVIQSCVDFGNFIPQGRNVLCAAICSRNSITLLRSFVRNIGLNGNVVIQNQFSAVRGLADILIQMVFRIAGVHVTIKVVGISCSSGIGLHIGAIPVLHVLSFSLATEIEVRVTVIHRVGSVINVQRHDSVPFRIRTVVQVLGFSRVHCFQLNVAAELIECFAAGHETLFKFSHSAVQLADVANLLANIAVLQCDGITDILELREAAAACHITVQPFNGGSTVFITVIGNLCGINGLVITCCAIGFTTLAQFIRIDSIQRNFLRATAIIRVGSRGCPCKVAVAGIVVIQQQRLSLQWRHLNGRCIDDKVTGTSLCNIVCRGSIGAHGMPGRLIGEDTAEIRAIPIHRCIREFQCDGGVLIECRFTCIHLRITASEGIRNPEIGRIPDTAAQSIIIISLGYITDFVLRGREQSRITANGNPVTAYITVLDLVGQAIFNAFPIERIEGEGSAAANGNTAVKSLFDIHRADFNVNITVTAIFSLVHAGIYRAAQSVFALELNAICGVIQLGVTYRACRIRQVTVCCFSERQAVNLAAHSAVRGIEGSARITDFHPIANLVVNRDNAVIPGNIGGFQLFIVIQLTVNRLVDRTFPVLIVINRVSGWGHQLQRMGLSVVPEMIRNIDRNHTKLSDLVAALIDDIGTHHTGGRQVRDNVLAIAVYNTVIVNAIGAMNNNLVTGIIGHAIRGREQCIQVTDNASNTSDANIRLIVQL